MAWPPTDEQQRVIDHDPSRHARILAGPGTGKSATVIRLMLRLGDEGKHGRLLTFTRPQRTNSRRRSQSTRRSAEPSRKARRTPSSSCYAT
ncbi:MAG: UvrD-helicase domain-containing protein [Acidimicrobiales bacterium]